MPLPKKPWKPRERIQRVINGNPVQWKRLWRRRYISACEKCGDGVVKLNDGATGYYVMIEWKSYRPGDIWFIRRVHRRHICEKELILKAFHDHGNDYLHPFAEEKMRREEYKQQKREERKEDLDV